MPVKSLWRHTIWYRYFNVHSKADISQLNLMYGTKTKKGKKTKCKNRYVRSIDNSLGNPGSQSWIKKGRLQWEGFAKKEGFKPVMKERESPEKRKVYFWLCHSNYMMCWQQSDDTLHVYIDPMHLNIRSKCWYLIKGQSTEANQENHRLPLSLHDIPTDSKGKMCCTTKLK